MRTVILMCVVIAGVLSSCGNGGKEAGTLSESSENSVRQQSDGSISLKLDKAAFYNDASDPSNNTAEWNVMLTKPGRFDVWLSSATKDTTSLKYLNAVLLSIRDKRLEAIPECDKVVLNSEDVSYPYFRADSFLGSLYIQDTGLVNIQVISEKILPPGALENAPDTRLISVSLTPVVR